MRAASVLKAPFLRSIRLEAGPEVKTSEFPFSLPVLNSGDFGIEFTHAVTIIVGANGSGKSTILEAIAGLCGFGRDGGNRNYARSEQGEDVLSPHLRASWLPKVGTGFFSRAETFSRLVAAMDAAGNQFESGRPLDERSHGEAYLDIFEKKIWGRGIFIFDEPEAALTPARQLEFLRIMRGAEAKGEAQFIIATHSPVIMAYPGASVLHLTDRGVFERSYKASEQYRMLNDFCQDPDGFMERVFDERG